MKDRNLKQNDNWETPKQLYDELSANAIKTPLPL
jgi:hypothetical protein